MPDLITLVLLVLAVTRLTGLVVYDRIGHPLRFWVVKKSGDNGWLTFGVHCPWCVGMWFAMAVAPMWWFWGRSPWFVIPCLALALSQAVGFLAKLNRGD